jgi:hypothetical protein
VSEAWPWAAVSLLGAFHGLNPAMGWLFAVALGFQERRRSAVLRALGPIALGHAIAVGAVVLFLVLGGIALPPLILRGLAGALLIGFGCFRLIRPGAHFRWVGMRVGAADLVLWSFLMATGHGAGLMLAPVIVHGSSGSLGLVAAHTVAMFLVMGTVAVLVFETVGLGILQRAWVNVDLIWAGALVVAGVVTLLG